MAICRRPRAALRPQHQRGCWWLCLRCYHSVMSLFAPIFSFVFVLPRPSYVFRRRMELRRRFLIHLMIVGF
jgi:hypothetical protein